MPSSIREQIVQAVKTRLEGMTIPTYEIEFDRVQRGEITSIGKGKKLIAAIFDDLDRRIPHTDPFVDVELDVDIDFVAYISRDEKPSTKLNLVLSEVERALMSDRTFGGLAIDSRLDRTEKESGGRFDKFAECSIFFKIKFRHRNSDPRSAT